MRCATAYSNSCSQVFLVYLRPFCRSSLLKCVLQPKNAEKSRSFKVINVDLLQTCRQLLRLMLPCVLWS